MGPAAFAFWSTSTSSIVPGGFPERLHQHPATAAGDSSPLPGIRRDPEHGVEPPLRAWQQRAAAALQLGWAGTGSGSPRARARCERRGSAVLVLLPARERVLNVRWCLSCCCSGCARAWHTRPTLPGHSGGTTGNDSTCGAAWQVLLAGGCSCNSTLFTA